jgi:ribosomal protein S3
MLVHFVYFQAVQDGIFKAELNNFLMKELAEDGYSGVEVRRTPARVEVIRCTNRIIDVLLGDHNGDTHTECAR